MSTQKIVKNIFNYIKQTNIENAISYAKMLGSFLWENNLDAFSVKAIEQYLALKVEEELSLKLKQQKNSTKEYLFVATELYFHGGHSRLAENLSTYIDSATDLLLTTNASDNIINREKTFFNEIYFIDKKNKNNLLQIEEVIKIIIDYKKVILNIHPNDIITVISCIVAKKLNPDITIFFVNHADHVFSFGVTPSDVWFEISQYGIEVDKKREITCQKSFLGIPAVIKNIDIEQPNFKNGDLIITAANRFKFKPFNGYSLMPLIDALLKKYKKSKCQIIGVDKYRDYWWWPLKLKYHSRLILTHSLPHDKYLEITSRSKLYIDSQPLTGGTAFVEQFFQGKLCAGLKGYSWGYTPLDYIKKDTPSEVLQYLNEDNKNLLEKVKQDSTLIHSPECVKNRFINALNGEYSSLDEIIHNSKLENTVINNCGTINYYPSKLPIYDFSQLILLFKLASLKLKFKLPFLYLKNKFKQ